MPDGFRFRTDWRGRLILQRSYEWHFGPDQSGYSDSETRWRDATVEDLTPYIHMNPTKEEAQP